MCTKSTAIGLQAQEQMMDVEPQQQAPRRVTPELQLRDLPARKEPHALWRAARAGDVDAVREAVSAGLSLDARDGLGRTPLVVAVVHGRKRCVDVLLDGGADPETPSGHRSRPLAYAAFRGDAALCARLLGAGADPNKKAADGWTALHVAARQGAADVVRLLLARGASRDARTGTGRTALVVATAFGELQTVRALLRAGARPDLNLLAMDPAEAEQSLFPLLQTVRSETEARARVKRGLATLRAVRDAGSWRRHLAGPRRDLVVIRALQTRCAARGRAAGGLPLDELPDPLFRHVACYFWGG